MRKKKQTKKTIRKIKNYNWIKWDQHEDKMKTKTMFKIKILKTKKK